MFLHRQNVRGIPNNTSMHDMGNSLDDKVCVCVCVCVCGIVYSHDL